MTRSGLAFSLALAWTSIVQAADWREAKWPFPRDAWPPGQAWSCVHQACTGQELFIARVKLGFCNCETGVQDDAEVDYVSDIDLVSPHFAALSSGQSMTLFGLNGRMRLYQYLQGTRPQFAIGMALSRKCDVLAMSIMALSSEQAARDILAFLAQSSDLRNYLAAKLGERL